MILEQKFNNRQLLIVPGDREQTIAFATNHFLSCAEKAIKDHKVFFVALSGGSTAKAIYEKLAQPPLNARIDWTKVHLFWSDERSVPPDHPDSNYHMAMESGLKTLPIPEANIHRMIAEADIENSATKYEALIKETLKRKHFDLIMLGMGDDGHTASLFPNTEGLNETKRYVIANHIPKLDTWRMTFTFPFINKALTTTIYVLGEKKKERLLAVLKPKKGDPPLPVQNIGTDRHKALFIADQPAASLF